MNGEFLWSSARSACVRKLFFKVIYWIRCGETHGKSLLFSFRLDLQLKFQRADAAATLFRNGTLSALAANHVTTAPATTPPTETAAPSRKGMQKSRFVRLRFNKLRPAYYILCRLTSDAVKHFYGLLKISLV